MSTLPLAITAGEPAGIGFDIILQSIPELNDCIVIADQFELQVRAKKLGMQVELCDHAPKHPSQIHVKHIPVSAPGRVWGIKPSQCNLCLSLLR